MECSALFNIARLFEDRWDFCLFEEGVRECRLSLTVLQRLPASATIAALLLKKTTSNFVCMPFVMFGPERVRVE